MIARLKAFKEKFIKSADTLSDAQLNRRMAIFKTLSIYYGAKMLLGGALVTGGLLTLGFGVAGIALPLPLWLGAGGLGVGALMLANGIISGRAFDKTYENYAKEKTTRLPEGAKPPAPSLSQGLKKSFDTSRKVASGIRAKIAAGLPHKAANDGAQPPQRKNAP